MPVVFTFDVTGAADVGGQSFQSRIQASFQRLGWQHLGGTAYRYPSLNAAYPTEDWLNHVIPAFFLFRTMALVHNVQLAKFTVDAQSSTGFDADTAVGTPPVSGPNIRLYPPNHQNMFGEANLINWIEGVTSPY